MAEWTKWSDIEWQILNQELVISYLQLIATNGSILPGLGDVCVPYTDKRTTRLLL